MKNNKNLSYAYEKRTTYGKKRGGGGEGIHLIKLKPRTREKSPTKNTMRSTTRLKKNGKNKIKIPNASRKSCDEPKKNMNENL